MRIMLCVEKNEIVTVSVDCWVVFFGGVSCLGRGGEPFWFPCFCFVCFGGMVGLAGNHCLL